MTTTITRGATVITPRLVIGYTSTRDSKNVIHDLWGTSAPAVSLGPLGTRSGTLEMLFLTEAESVAAESAHALSGSFLLADTDRPSVGMTYVVAGRVTRSLDASTGTRWLLSVDFREATP